MFGGHCLAADRGSMQRPLAFQMTKLIGSSKAACSGTRRCHVGSLLHLHLDNLTGECTYVTQVDIKCSSDNLFFVLLKVPKCETFDRSDFHYFNIIMSLWEGDFWGLK